MNKEDIEILKKFINGSFIIYNEHIIFTGIPKEIHEEVLKLLKSITKIDTERIWSEEEKG